MFARQRTKDGDLLRQPNLLDRASIGTMRCVTHFTRGLCLP